VLFHTASLTPSALLPAIALSAIAVPAIAGFFFQPPRGNYGYY
jgi:hypothetical protein